MKSVESFKAAGYSKNQSIQYSVFGFFAGSLLTHLLDVILEKVSARFHLNIPSTLGEKLNLKQMEGNHRRDKDVLSSEDQCISLSETPPRENSEDQTNDVHVVIDPPQDLVSDTVTSPEDQKHKNSIMSESCELQRMGFFSAVIIFLHNLPEGLATYVSVIADPQAGAAVAFAIALHNIPEVRASLQSSPSKSSMP
jgi:zinc transporter ZupT